MTHKDEAGALARINAVAGKNRKESLAFLRALIAAGEKGEEAVQAVVADAARGLGAEVRTRAYQPGKVPILHEFAGGSAQARGRRAAVVSRVAGTGGGRSLIFFAHPDSEPVNGLDRWRKPPFAGRIVKGRLHGWGVADDLAGVAIMVEAMRVHRLSGLPLAGDVILASTPSKRHARGVSALLRAGLKADAAVYLHPAESGRGMAEIKALTCGHLEFRVRIKGRQPPTTEPLQTGFAHLGVNPVEKAMLVIEALRRFDRTRARRLSEPALQEAVGRSTNLMVSAIAAGDPARLARMPATCEVGFALSFPPKEKLMDVKRAVEAALAKTFAADAWLAENSPEVLWDSGTSAAATPPDHPLYGAVSRAVRSVTRKPPIFNPMHTGSDIRNPIVQSGIPTVGMGPLCGDLSQNGGHDEWVDAEDYLKAIAAAAAIIATWCGPTR